MRHDPDNVDARLALGQFLLLGKDDEFNQALAQADAVNAKQPDSWQAWVIKGRAFENLKRLDEAQAAYQKSLELAPKNADLVRTLANFYARKGDRERAEQLYKQLLEMDPSARSYFLFASYLTQDKARDAEAEAAYKKALELAKDDEKPEAFQRLASYYYARERYDEAEATLKQGLDATNKNLDVIYALARFYHSRGAKDKADRIRKGRTSFGCATVASSIIASALSLAPRE